MKHVKLKHLYLLLLSLLSTIFSACKKEYERDNLFDDKRANYTIPQFGLNYEIKEETKPDGVLNPGELVKLQFSISNLTGQDIYYQRQNPWDMIYLDLKGQGELSNIDIQDGHISFTTREKLYLDWTGVLPVTPGTYPVKLTITIGKKVVEKEISLKIEGALVSPSEAEIEVHKLYIQSETIPDNGLSVGEIIQLNPSAFNKGAGDSYDVDLYEVVPTQNAQYISSVTFTNGASRIPYGVVQKGKEALNQSNNYLEIRIKTTAIAGETVGFQLNFVEPSSGQIWNSYFQAILN